MRKETEATELKTNDIEICGDLNIELKAFMLDKKPLNILKLQLNTAFIHNDREVIKITQNDIDP